MNVFHTFFGAGPKLGTEFPYVMAFLVLND
jgi:hypothetical protein